VRGLSNVLPPIVAHSVNAVVAGDFDMIFIDAMHEYPDVKADIERWWPKVRSGGVLALHDYRHRDFPGVAQAADEIFGEAAEGTTLYSLRWIQKLPSEAF